MPQTIAMLDSVEEQRRLLEAGFSLFFDFVYQAGGRFVPLEPQPLIHQSAALVCPGWLWFDIALDAEESATQRVGSKRSCVFARIAVGAGECFVCASREVFDDDHLLDQSAGNLLFLNWLV